MNKIALAAVAAFALSTIPAAAGDVLSIQRDGRGFIQSFTHYNVDASPRVIRVRPKEDTERAARWEAYCDPKTVMDRFGVERYVYAKPGCEFGRDHD